MKKLHRLFTIWGGVVCIALASCNFFDDSSDFKEKLEKDIAYANAKSIEIIVSPEEGTGSTIPSGKQTVKQGYPIEVSFTEAGGWSFVKWIAVSKKDSSKIFESGVDFDDASSLRTNATVRIDSADVRIVPFCTDRISVVGEPNPKYDANGVSRDRSITVEFSKEPSASSFIFREDELPQNASPITNENGEIWAYTLDDQKFFKNISITNADGYSLAAHFKQPLVEGKLLTVEADKSNPILFGTGETLKTVIVTLADEISDADGVTMTAEKSWRYQITEATDEKATVNFVSVLAEGSISAVSKAYSIGQKISLGFSENTDYQFVRWDYDTNIIYIENNRKSDTTITVLEKTSESEPTQVKAVCTPRLRVSSFSPVTGAAKTSVSKNTSISIEFSNALPNDEAGLVQLENISIAVGGSPVKSSFLKPVVIGNTVTFTADRSNMLDVPSGQTKTVTVSIPADFYYQLDDGTKVTFGGNGKSFDYKIDETTNEKAVISFIVKNADSGKFTKASGNNNSYSLDERIDITFDLKQGWQFNGWKVLDEDGKELKADEVKIAAITVEEPSSLSTKLCVNKEVQGITVMADTSKKLAVEKFSPEADTNPKDSDIEILFNTALDSSCAEMLSDIKITLDGVNVDSSFETRNLSTDGKKVTLKNTKRLTVAEGTTKTVKVAVPDSFFYKDGDVALNLESGATYSFVVDGTSKAQTEVTFSSKTGTVTPAAGTTHKYSLDTEIPLIFEPNPGYQFNEWTVTDKNGKEIPETQIKIADKTAVSTKMYVYEAVSGVTVTASASENLSVTATTPTAELNPKDSSITITFNNSLDSLCGKPEFLNQIKVKLDGTNVDSYFASRSLNANKITLSNTKFLNVTGSETKTISVTVPTTFFYKDGNVAINLAEVYSFEYEVSSATTKQTGVTYDVATANSGTMNQNGTASYNVGETVALKFNLSDGYQFIGWQVTDSDGNAISEDKIKIDDESALSTKLQILAYQSDVKVTANAILLPAVSSYNPANTETVFANEAIRINFNTPINESFFRYEKDFVSISDNGTSVTSLFDSPSIDETKTVLTLRPSERKLYEYILSKNAAYIDLAVSLGEKITVTKTYGGKEYTLSLRQNEKSSFAVRYEPKIESVKPQKFDFFATKSEISLDSAGTVTSLTDVQKFTQEEIAAQGNFSDEEYKAKILQNRTNGTIYIYGRYYDADSGVNAVRITHERTNSKAGTAVSENIVTNPLFTKNSENARFFTKDGYTSFCVKYEIPDDEEKSDLGDGAILVKMSVLDAAGNESEAEKFTAIKDNYVDLSGVNFRNYQADYYAVKSLYWNIADYSSDEDFYQKEIVPLTKRIYLTSFKYTEKYTPLHTYGNYNLKTCPKDNVYIEYESKAGNTRQKMEWNDETRIFETDINVDSVTGLSIKLCVEDEFGNKNSRDYIFPDKLKVCVGLDTSTEEYAYKVYDTTGYILGIAKNESSGKYYAGREFATNAFGTKWIYFADISTFVGDAVKVGGSFPTSKNTGSFASFSGMSFEDKKCFIHFKSDVWEKYSSVICKGVFTYYYGSYGQAVPADRSEIPYGFRTSTFEQSATSSDGLEACLYTAFDIQNYYLDIELTLYGLDSNGKLQAKTNTKYTIKLKSEDTKGPSINSVTALKPSERSEKLGSDEARLNDWLIVNASDFYTDSSNNIYFSGLDHFDIYVKNLNTYIKTASVKVSNLKKLSTNEYAVPLYGRNSYGGVSYRIIAYDAQNNASSEYSGSISGYFQAGYNIGKVTYSNGNCTVDIWNRDLGYYSLKEFYLHVYKFENGIWNFQRTFSSSDINSRSIISMQVDSNYVYKFIPECLVSMNRDWWVFNPPYILNACTKSSGNYDLIIPNGSSKSSVAVSSDQPVFVQTIVTVKDYDTCKSWDAAKWEENFPKHVGDSVLDFSPSDHSPKRYVIPVDLIHEGECYVVIAHFADGSTAMSEVMQK